MASANVIPQAVKEQILALYQQDVPAGELAARFGIKRETVYALRRRLGGESKWVRKRRGLRDAVVGKLAVAQKAYLAALIDGEGHIGLHRNRSIRLYKAFMNVVMTGEVLKEMQAEFGVGTVSHRPKSLKTPNHKDCWAWMFSPNAMRVILPEVLPYMRVKRRQAELLLEYLGLAESRFWKTRGDFAGYEKRVTEIHAEVRQLNHRGGLPQ